jgi:anthranilate phosphoribosyltransferase
VLTGAGDELLVGHVPAVIETIERWFTGELTSEQLAALLAALRMIRRRVRPEAAAGADG